MRSLIAIALAALAGCMGSDTQASDVPVYGYTVVHTYPHDTGAFTEGLFWLHGYLYESTGTLGRSTVRKVDLASGEVVQQRHLDQRHYGEGIVAWKDKLIQLTWKSGTGFIYDLESFKPVGEFTYAGEGWALTLDGRHILMSDGSSQIRVLDPDTLKELRRIDVTLDGQPVRNINELEWVKGEIFANIWLTDRIVRIDPTSGHVVGIIDLAGLAPTDTRDPADDVLNGIAWDARGERLFVTGKRWPHLYEIRLTL